MRALRIAVAGRWVIAFTLSVIAANWAIERFGIVGIGFGLTAPAGVFFAGLTFTFRDLIHESLGRWWALAAIMIGAGLSWFVSPQFAVASAGAFLLAEGLDFGVYTPLRERHWIGAVIASNVVGFVADSAVFLLLAFGSLEYLTGQVVGKAYMTALAVPVLLVWRHRQGLSWGWQPERAQ